MSIFEWCILKIIANYSSHLWLFFLHNKTFKNFYHKIFINFTLSENYKETYFVWESDVILFRRVWKRVGGGHSWSLRLFKNVEAIVSSVFPQEMEKKRILTSARSRQYIKMTWSDITCRISSERNLTADIKKENVDWRQSNMCQSPRDIAQSNGPRRPIERKKEEKRIPPYQEARRKNEKRFLETREELYGRSNEKFLKSKSNINDYPPITYYWTGLLISDHSDIVGNLTNSKIAETKSLEPLKSWHLSISNFWICSFPNDIWVVQD